MKKMRLWYLSFLKGSDHIQMPSVQLEVDESTRNYLKRFLLLRLEYAAIDSEDSFYLFLFFLQD